jgi:Large polyvalent protein-associated domain 7
VIGHRGDQRLHVKASDVDRGLSMQALTGALGPYEPPGPAAAEGPEFSYAQPARTGPLYEAFKQERDASLAARDAAMTALRERHAAYHRQLRDYYRDRMRRERLTGLRGILRRDSFWHIADLRTRDHATRKAREAEDRRQVRDRHPIPTWQGFLEAEAARGDEAALRALRARQRQRERVEAALLEAADAGEARHIVYQHLRPLVRRDGRVIYRVADGGLVSDEARQVRVNQVTAGAAFLALTLAVDRFGARPLNVTGTEDFRRQVAQLAGIKGLGVTFADAGLERQRQVTVATRANAIDRGAERD